MKIYTITHKEFIPPADSLYVPLHVGHAKFKDGTPDYGYMGDDTGENISSKNHLYSELTGLYWIWKNGADDDYEGLVHYRRYFADKDGKLLDEAGYRRELAECDIIIGEHIEYEVSYKEKFAEYHHGTDLDKTGDIIKKIYPDYYETFLEVINSKEQYVFNMMVTSKKLLNDYAKWLFDIFFQLEKVIDVSGYDSYRARIYGFLSEELLYVWIKKNGLKYKELPVIYSQEKAETIEFKKNLKEKIETEGYESAHEYFLKVFKERPDLTLEDSDFSQELRIILYILEYAHDHSDKLNNKAYFKEYFKKFSTIDRLLTRLVSDDFDMKENVEEYITNLSIATKEELSVITRINSELSSYKDRIAEFIMSDLFNYNHVECLVLYYDSSQDLNATVESINRQSYKNIKMTVVDLVEQDFPNMASLKNEALKFATLNRICFISAGDILDETDVETVMKQEYHVAAEVFDSVIVDGVNATALTVFDKRALDRVGRFNDKLVTGEDYELILRVCDGEYDETGFARVNTVKADLPVYPETYEIYAYVIAKYASRLKDNNLFENVFAQRLEEAKGYGIESFFIQKAEGYISRGKEFLEIDRVTRPLLILMGENLCRGILDGFAKDFAKAVVDNGSNAIVFDIRNGGINGLLEMSKREYKAVIGFQTELFTMQLTNGDLLGNSFRCPKIQWTFDHPLFFSYHLMLPIKDYYLFSQDGNYARYAKEYYSYVKDAWHISPAGNRAENKKNDVWENKKYNLTFIGAFNNYRDRFENIRNMKKEDRVVALKLINILKHEPNLPIEEGLKIVLKGMNKSDIENREFVVFLHHMLEVGRLMSFYYREKVIRSILKAGITLDVFSNLWKNSPFATDEHLIIHEDISYEDSMRIMQESRISLNVMSWHKDGMTERIANAMLNGSVCLTDKTTYIEKHFTNGQDCIWFELDKLEEMVHILNGLLEKSDEELRAISDRAFLKASSEHTWESRAKQVIEIISNL